MRTSVNDEDKQPHGHQSSGWSRWRLLRWSLAVLILALLFFFLCGVVIPLLLWSRVNFCAVEACSATSETTGYFTLPEGRVGLELCGLLAEQSVRSDGVVYADLTLLLFNPSLVPFVARDVSGVGLEPAQLASFGSPAETAAGSLARGAAGACTASGPLLLPALSWSSHTVRCTVAVGDAAARMISAYASESEVSVGVRARAVVAPAFAPGLALTQRTSASNEVLKLTRGAKTSRAAADAAEAAAEAPDAASADEEDPYARLERVLRDSKPLPVPAPAPVAAARCQ